MTLWGARALPFEVIVALKTVYRLSQSGRLYLEQNTGSNNEYSGPSSSPMSSNFQMEHDVEIMFSIIIIIIIKMEKT
jgi:hypothetical protein